MAQDIPGIYPELQRPPSVHMAGSSDPNCLHPIELHQMQTCADYVVAHSSSRGSTVCNAGELCSAGVLHRCTYTALNDISVPACEAKYI